MSTAQLKCSSTLRLPSDTYVYEALPTHTGEVAAILSDDSLRLLLSSTLREIPDATIRKAHDGVTCLQTVEQKGNVILTAGRDGKVRGWDLRVGQKGVKTVEFTDSSSAAYLSLASNGQSIAAGTELTHSQASVLVWDNRNPSVPIVEYVESHNDDVTELRYHPSEPSLLLSGSTDSLINIFDTRIPSEEDALFQITNHGSSIHHAGFLDGGSTFFGLSHDESFSIYRTNKAAEINETEAGARDDIVFGDLRETLECEYVVDIIHLGSQPMIAAGSHSKSNLTLHPLGPPPTWPLDLNYSHALHLPGAHGEEIVRSIAVVEETQTLYTAGEDGTVKAWSLPTSHIPTEDEEMQEAAEQLPKKKKRRHDEGGVSLKGTGEGRFRPY